MRRDRELPSIGFLSTYPPTQCGLATFTAALRGAIADTRGSDEGLGVVSLVDERLDKTRPEVVYEHLNGDHTSLRSAIEALNSFDVAFVQHEYGIYAGPDGSEVLDLLSGLEAPAIVTLHTVLSQPRPNQRSILEQVVAMTEWAIVMSHTARRRLINGYRVDPAKVRMIPHGATVDLGGPSLANGTRPVVLTWGLIGPGKGLETAIDAFASLRDLRPLPRYVILGEMHPKIRASQGDAYFKGLAAQVHDLGLDDVVQFDTRYPDTDTLAIAVRQADLVVLPYESTQQVTSGVLVEAIAAGKPVVATAFPHAVELLGTGAGIVVPHHDPTALAAALRRVLTHRSLAARMTWKARLIGSTLFWPTIARQYDRLATKLATRHLAAQTLTTAERPLEIVNAPSSTVGVSFSHLTSGEHSVRSDSAPGQSLAGPLPAPRFDHLRRMTDRLGLWEHARYTVPRTEHGYCTDDNARALIVISRRPSPSRDLVELAKIYLAFLQHAQLPDGGFHNRRNPDGSWADEVGSGDSQGRALWALGSVAHRGPASWMREVGLAMFDRQRGFHSPSPRANSFAVLGATEVLLSSPDHRHARHILEQCADRLLLPNDTRWPWPEERLAYDNARLPEALIAAGSLLPDDGLVDAGLHLLEWLVATETLDGHFSFTPVGGWAPDEPRPGFDQQPLEAAAMADACSRAWFLTGESRWKERVERAARWFMGANDTGAALYDPQTGGCGDGLGPNHINLNQGAESTLAALAALQQAELVGGPRCAGCTIRDLIAPVA
ncbi:MAG: glycosyltransferase [Gammaproteobacteria bacterium]|nr:glycosyltransferase [Gammaproteobacteria bacterium]